eukprot:CAMPEP_0196659248 /NCGR_PEP_ID=MMETSP1086-20130531/33938_1 /TAXON_ID=77921 /ORGANISM="Cyanoptyche  gloeocystis , Strain SAG4.97" /LENGTH=427 /DNA_ID=CAMNT_0041993137 /DNA_START=83 /DNA_END=1363 /DNA_ORIENTATION=-
MYYQFCGVPNALGASPAWIPSQYSLDGQITFAVAAPENFMPLSCIQAPLMPQSQATFLPSQAHLMHQSQPPLLPRPSKSSTAPVFVRGKKGIVWTQELHQRFVDAVNTLGLDQCCPKKILLMMNVQGLTRENVSSHLQKYRVKIMSEGRQRDGSKNVEATDSCQLSDSYGPASDSLDAVIDSSVLTLTATGVEPDPQGTNDISTGSLSSVSVRSEKSGSDVNSPRTAVPFQNEADSRTCIPQRPCVEGSRPDLTAFRIGDHFAQKSSVPSCISSLDSSPFPIPFAEDPPAPSLPRGSSLSRTSPGRTAELTKASIAAASKVLKEPLETMETEKTWLTDSLSPSTSSDCAKHHSTSSEASQDRHDRCGSTVSTPSSTSSSTSSSSSLCMSETLKRNGEISKLFNYLKSVHDEYWPQRFTYSPLLATRW